MKIAVIIVTYNGSRYIVKCLASVFRNKYEGEFEVFVVDNASSDGTIEILEHNFNVIPAQAGIQKDGSPIKSGMTVNLIRNDTNLGFVGGNNIGIKRALEKGADYVVLLNQDTEVEYDWLEKLVKVGETENGVGIVQSMLLLASERALTNNVGNAMHYLGFGFVKHYREPADSWYRRPAFEIGYASGAGMLIKREVLEKLRTPPSASPKGERPRGELEGGVGEREKPSYFNPLFFAYHEDLDLCWRARLAGYKIMIAPQAIVYHHYQFNRNKKMFYWTERNRWICLWQNYSLKTLFLISPMLLFTELAMLVYSLFGGWFLQKVRGYVWLWLHLPQIWRQRRQAQAMRSVSDKEILRQMESKLEFSEVDNFVLRQIVSPVVGWYYERVLGIRELGN